MRTTLRCGTERERGGSPPVGESLGSIRGYISFLRYEYCFCWKSHLSATEPTTEPQEVASCPKEINQPCGNNLTTLHSLHTRMGSYHLDQYIFFKYVLHVFLFPDVGPQPAPPSDTL